MSEGPQLKAGGDINPCRFVSMSTTVNGTVVESNAADAGIMGISQEGVKEAPQSGASTLAAASGDHVRLFFPGSVCPLEMNATGCTVGDFLKPDNSGKGDVADTAGDVSAAQALESAAGGEKCLVRVLEPAVRKHS